MTISDSVGTALSTLGPDESDATLIEGSRDGDRSAYAELYRRYGPMARRFARSLVGTDADADDVVAEVFAAILSAMERGRGPSGTFAPYLMTSVRNECYRVNRRQRRETTDRCESVDGDGGSVVHTDPYDRMDEMAVLRVAFASLPSHQQELLWQTEVDEVHPTELARRDGCTPNAVAMMAMRARRALGSAYLGQHCADDHEELAPECREARPHLVGFVRGTLGVRRRRRLEAHLADCTRCREAREGLDRVNTHLRALPVLPFNGAAGAAGTASLGLKAQVLGWLTAQAVPVAMSGMVAVSVLGPVGGVPLSHRSPVVEAAAPRPTVLSLSPSSGAEHLLAEALMTTTPWPDRTTTEGGPGIPLDRLGRVSSLFSDPGGAESSSTPAASVDPPGLLPVTLDAGSSSTISAVPTSPEGAPAMPGAVPGPSTHDGVPSSGAEANGDPSPGTPPSQSNGNPIPGTPPSHGGAGAADAVPANGNGNSNGRGGTSPGSSNGGDDGHVGTPPGQANGNAGTPPGQGSAHGATPPGLSNGGGNAGTPPGQGSAHGATPPGLSNGGGNAGTPPGQGSAHGATPPGLSNGGGNAGTPPGQGSAHGATPPGLSNGGGNAGTPPAQSNSPANGTPGTPPGQSSRTGSASAGQSTVNGAAASPPAQSSGDLAEPPGQSAVHGSAGGTPAAPSLVSGDRTDTTGTPPGQVSGNGDAPAGPMNDTADAGGS